MPNGSGRGGSWRTGSAAPGQPRGRRNISSSPAALLERALHRQTGDEQPRKYLSLVLGMVAGVLKLFDLDGLGQQWWHVGGVKLLFCALSLAVPAAMFVATFYDALVVTGRGVSQDLATLSTSVSHHLSADPAVAVAGLEAQRGRQTRTTS